MGARGEEKGGDMREKGKDRRKERERTVIGVKLDGTKGRKEGRKGGGT